MEVPEWGGHLFVRSLTGAERDAFEDSMRTGKGRNISVNLQNFRARLVVLTACDEAGAAIFEDTDVRRLGEKSAAALEHVYAVAARLAGLTAEDAEELTGNSGTAPSESSISD